MRVLGLLLFTFFISGCASTQLSGSFQGHDMLEAQQTITDMVNHVDAKRWQDAAQTMTEEVKVDYSELSGQPETSVQAGDLVASWESLLGAVNTHHMLSNFEVSVSGKKAVAYSHVQASHFAEGVKPWHLYGRYRHDLLKTPSGWKITGMKLMVDGQTGNMAFFQELNQ